MKKKNINKPLYYSRTTYSKIKNEVLKSLTMVKYKNIVIYNYDKKSTVLKYLDGRYILVYNGKKWQGKGISKWMMGFKIGSFTWTRRRYRKKLKKSKKKSKK